MNFSKEDFVTIKRTTNKLAMPDNQLRINANDMSLSGNISKAFQDEEVATRAYITLHYSEKHQAFLLEKGGANAFSFVVDKKGGPSKIFPFPKALAPLKPKRGVYQLAPDSENVFVLSEEIEETPGGVLQDRKTKYLVEDIDVEQGDIVSWSFRGDKGRSRTQIATGEVEMVYAKEETGDPTSKWATVIPISTNYCTEFPSRTRTTLKTENLIIREKKDV